MVAIRRQYSWDIFISYTHTGNVATWVREYFHPELRDWIRNEVGIRDPRIFVDRFDIRTGDEWSASWALRYARRFAWSPY